MRLVFFRSLFLMKWWAWGLFGVWVVYGVCVYNICIQTDGHQRRDAPHTVRFVGGFFFELGCGWCMMCV